MHSFNWSFWNNKHDIIEVYLAQIFYGIGIALVGVFIPIYLLKLGYTIQEALWYLLVENLIVIFISPIAAVIGSRYGLKHATIIRIPFFLISFLALYGLSQNWGVPFLLPAITAAIARPLYWIPIHSLFARYSSPRMRGSQVGMLQAMPAAFRILAPAIGGIIASSLGFPILIIIGLFIAALSTLPLFSTGEVRANPSFSWSKPWRVKEQKFLSISVVQGFATVATAYLFPLLVFTSLNSAVSVGWITSAGMLIFAAASYIIGKHIDKSPHNMMLSLGAVLFALTIIARPFLNSHLTFSIIIMLGGLFWAVYITSYNTLMYSMSNKLGKRLDEFIVLREIFLNLGRVSALALAIIIPWKMMFFVAPSALIMSAGFLRM